MTANLNVTNRISIKVENSLMAFSDSFNPGKRAGVARLPLAAYLGEGTLLFQTLAVLRKYPLVEKNFRR